MSKVLNLDLACRTKSWTQDSKEARIASHASFQEQRTGSLHVEETRTTSRSHLCRRTSRKRRLLGLTALAVSLPQTMAQNCISLSQSSQCSAFNASSISTDSSLTGLFPFLSTVTDTASFDSGIQTYISGAFAQQRYQQLIGCSAFDASNTTDYYARYTTSVICNTIVQNSITPCGLSGSATAPLCADSCSQYAASEEAIADSNLCGASGPNAMSQIRADFTNCALPADSLSGSCIEAVRNEPNNCGYNDNLGGLCSYCAASSPNATDSCCVYSNTENTCQGVVLPIAATSASSIVFSKGSSTSLPTSTASSSPSAAAVAHRRTLSGGAIAGIVIGSILGALLLLALLILACLLIRRRERRQKHNSLGSASNKSIQARQAPPMAMHDGASGSQREVSALPGGRVVGMAALEGGGGTGRGSGAYAAPGGRNYGSSASEDTPESRRTVPPKRGHSLGGNSPFLTGDAMEDSPGQDFSSPEGTGQSERLNFFKDYYSQDEVHTGDLVATLWAYQPRAQDEFELERGDMLKVVGIWDDGWATGMRVRQRAEDWRDEYSLQRDSGMTSGSSSNDSSPAPGGSVKAFPLVCVCLPQYWQKTIEGETTETSMDHDMTESSP